MVIPLANLMTPHLEIFQEAVFGHSFILMEWVPYAQQLIIMLGNVNLETPHILIAIFSQCTGRMYLL